MDLITCYSGVGTLRRRLPSAPRHWERRTYRRSPSASRRRSPGCPLLGGPNSGIAGIPLDAVLSRGRNRLNLGINEGRGIV